MISKRATREFFNRKLRDSRKMKKLSEKAIDRKIAKLDPQPQWITTRPRGKYQKVAFLLGIRHPGYFFCLDLGLGKSAVTLFIYRYRKLIDPDLKPLLVLVPNVVNITSWEDEIEKHAPDLRFGRDVQVITYQGASIAVSSLIDGEKKSKYVKDNAKARRFAQQFGMVAFDESDAVKNSQSLWFAVCRKLARHIPFRYCLSATPFDKNPQDLWSQFYLIDFGETLGATLGLFRAAFCSERENRWTGFPEWHFRAAQQDVLNRMLRHSSLRYEVQECDPLELPEMITHRIVFSESAWSYYDRLVTDLTEAKNRQVIKNAFVRMRQLTSGFMTVRDPKGNKEIIDFEDNPKLEALVSLIRASGDRRMIVFNEYIHSSDVICKRLKQEKIDHLRIYGQTTPDEKRKALQAFRAGKAKVLVMNTAAGGKGLNLQVANYIVFYESPTSSIQRKQAIGRCQRPGQERRVTVVDLVVKGSIDERVLEYVLRGEDLFKAVMNGDRGWLKQKGKRRGTKRRSQADRSGRSRKAKRGSSRLPR